MKAKFSKFQIIRWNGDEYTVYDIHQTVDGIVWYYIARREQPAEWVNEKYLVAA